MYFILFNKKIRTQKNILEVIEKKAKYLIPFNQNLEDLELEELGNKIKAIYPNIEHITMKDINICAFNRYWTKNSKGEMVTCVINEKARKEIQDLGLFLNGTKEFGKEYINTPLNLVINGNSLMFYKTVNLDKDILFGTKTVKQKVEWRCYNKDTKEDKVIRLPYGVKERNILKYIDKEECKK